MKTAQEELGTVALHSAAGNTALPAAAIRPPRPGPAGPDQAWVPALTPPRLGWWNVYFIAKLALFWREIIGFHALENLAFAAVLLVPLRSRRLAVGRAIVAVPIAAALLYYDSWLPPFERLLDQASLISRFSPAYLAELAGRFVGWPAVAAIVILAACYAIVATRIRVGVPVMAALIGLAFVGQPKDVGTAAVAESRPPPTAPGLPRPAADPAGGDTLEGTLREHYQREKSRRVAFAPPTGGAAPFDVLFLHVCSLSWDDLRATGADGHPLFARMDILLTRFNSAASYSGPALVRMLRAPCGQTSHHDLYSPAPDHCYLLPALKRAGFEPEVVLNHDGHFDDFLGILRAQGMPGVAPLTLAGLPAAQRSFDGSPIYDDLAVLSRWADRRLSGSPRAAYFNTISLHDGNRLVGAQAGRSSLATYPIRLQKLLDDLHAFVAMLDRGSRPTVVVLVPEHGAAFRGDKTQIAGMREIPTPAITLVPAGVMVAGAGVTRTGEPVRVDAPTSHLALAHLLARLLERSPFSPPGFSAGAYLADLPSTRFVAENADTVMMQARDEYHLRLDKAGWTQYATTPM